MSDLQNKVRAALIRGGTSKGVFFHKDALPKNEAKRDHLLLSIMGSPDPSGMQLNGLGGGISSTSKVALISPSERENIHVDYLFGQVSIKEPKIDWAGSCGNLAAAVALYAIHEGLVQPSQDSTTLINIWQENLGYEIQTKVYPPDHLISIPGVPGTSSAIYVDFINTSPSLLPNNQAVHLLHLPDGQRIEATLISGANPTIFIHASALGLTGDELPGEIVFSQIEKAIHAISMEAAKIMEVPYSSAIRVAWVSPPKNYTSSNGSKIDATECDILSRISTEGRVHHAHTGTGAINLACAAKIPGSIPHQIIKNRTLSGPIRIAHPLGVMQVDANVIQDAKTGNWTALSSGFMRTAKLLMIGDAFIN